MKIEIYPYIGFDKIKFGFTREQIRSLINDKVNPFFRTKDSKVATDSFDRLGIFVNYDETDCCEAIEFVRPLVEPLFLEKNLFGLSYVSLLSWFNELDSNIDEFDAGFTSYKYGIGFYAPEKEEDPNLPCEGVIIFRKGYYDD